MAKEKDRGIFGTSNYWRASMTAPRFLLFDARLIAAFLLLIFHLRMWTFFVLVATAVVLYAIENYGYRLPNALRGVRSIISGRRRPARSLRYYRSSRDLGFEDHPMIQHRMKKYRRELEKAERQSAANDAGPTTSVLKSRKRKRQTKPAKRELKNQTA